MPTEFCCYNSDVNMRVRCMDRVFGGLKNCPASSLCGMAEWLLRHTRLGVHVPTVFEKAILDGEAPLVKDLTDFATFLGEHTGFGGKTSPPPSNDRLRRSCVREELNKVRATARFSFLFTSLSLHFSSSSSHTCRKDTRAHTHTHTHTLSLSLSLSHAHTHTHTRTHTHVRLRSH
jgi:hypothetical protein